MKKRTIQILAGALLVWTAVQFLAVLPAAAEQDQTKLVALTFDDGPGNRTGELLDAMAERGVKATFFLVGERVAWYDSVVRRMAADGHQLGSHTFTHADLTALNTAQIAQELQSTRDVLEKYGGAQMYYLRPPCGAVNSAVVAHANAPIILWSVDPEDWCCYEPQRVADRVIADVQDGDIILMHDLFPSSVDAAILIMDALAERGYDFVTVSELLQRRGITPTDGVCYHNARAGAA